jgi:hypothetical protein
LRLCRAESIRGPTPCIATGNKAFAVRRGLLFAGATCNHRALMTGTSTRASEVHAESHTVFFRQGGWLVLATGLSGVFMLATQIVAQRMPKTEYLLFIALLRVYLLLGIPSIGLQTVFAQQAAASVTASEQAMLRATVRAVLRATLTLWLGVAALTLVAQDWLLNTLKISHPSALWITLLTGLGCLWAPILKGVVQGQQHFAALGSSLIVDGLGRFIAVTIIVLAGGTAAGGMAGALMGVIASTALCAWIARDTVFHRAKGFHWGGWLRRVVPLTLGMGTVVLLSTADVVYVQSVFPKGTPETYVPAAMVGLALMTCATPLAQVMFPKVARSAALSQRSKAMALALGITGAGGAVGALICTAWPELPLRVIFFSKPEYWAAAPLVPVYAWAVLPLTVANVLVSSLLARARFKVVPWVVGVGALYLAYLGFSREDFLTVAPLTAFRRILIGLGVSNAMLLGVALWFTFRERVVVAEAVPSV